MTDHFMRQALWATAIYNTGAALAFLFPGSLGALVGLPADAPLLHGVFLALFIQGFGVLYGWLALSERIDRGLVAFSGLMKASVFLLFLTLWITGHAGVLLVLVGIGDLAFAIIFHRWLKASGEPAPA